MLIWKLWIMYIWQALIWHYKLFLKQPRNLECRKALVDRVNCTDFIKRNVCFSECLIADSSCGLNSCNFVLQFNTITIFILRQIIAKSKKKKIIIILELRFGPKLAPVPCFTHFLWVFKGDCYSSSYVEFEKYYCWWHQQRNHHIFYSSIFRSIQQCISN